jgi:hypothetical protein
VSAGCRRRNRTGSRNGEGILCGPHITAIRNECSFTRLRTHSVKMPNSVMFDCGELRDLLHRGRQLLRSQGALQRPCPDSDGKSHAAVAQQHNNSVAVQESAAVGVVCRAALLKCQAVVHAQAAVQQAAGHHGIGVTRFRVDA